MICGGAVVVHVADVARAVRFYIETLGMKLVSEDAETSIIDAGGGFRLELRAGTSRASQIHLYTKVPLEEVIAIFENRGVEITVQRHGEKAVSGHFDDPDANRFVLLPLASDERLH